MKQIIFYENILRNIYFLNQQISDLTKYSVNSLKFWKEYENPSFIISEIYPKVDVSTQKPYYRAQSSFTNNGKKERISVYIGPIINFGENKEDVNLKKIAIDKIRKQMIEKSNLYGLYTDSNIINDRYVDEKFEEILEHLKSI
jgi:hypothetical protein